MPTDLFGEESDLPQEPLPYLADGITMCTVLDLQRFLDQYDDDGPGHRSLKDIEVQEFGKTRSNGKFICELWRKYLGVERATGSKTHQEIRELHDENVRLKKVLKAIVDEYEGFDLPQVRLVHEIEAARNLLQELGVS